jgi:ABC-type phosphate transport system ATPase subunit
MENTRLTGAAESLNVRYLRKSVLVYLNRQGDWKFVVAIIRQSGLGKSEVLDVLKPLRSQGWKFRSQALFAWLEQR